VKSPVHGIVLCLGAAGCLKEPLAPPPTPVAQSVSAAPSSDRVWVVTPGGSSLATAEVIDAQTNTHVPFTRFSLGLKHQAMSGGHNHKSPPPPPDAVTVTPFFGTEMITGADGTSDIVITSKQVVSTFQESGISGEWLIASVRCPDLEAQGRTCGIPQRTRIEVRVDGLEDLSGVLGKADDPVVTGVGPLILTGKTNDHPANHWGTPGTNGALSEIAKQFFEVTHVGLRVNDMSLQWGGLFDCASSTEATGCGANRPWLNPHKSHNSGDVADLDIGYLIDVAQLEVVRALNLDPRLFLRWLVDTCGGRINPLERGHHHVTFGGARTLACANIRILGYNANND
jgi:hypothetical protein